VPAVTCSTHASLEPRLLKVGLCPTNGSSSDGAGAVKGAMLEAAAAPTARAELGRGAAFTALLRDTIHPAKNRAVEAAFREKNRAKEPCARPGQL
jgi:hypothetical protein